MRILEIEIIRPSLKNRKKTSKNMLKKPVNMIKNEVKKVSGVHELSKINPLTYIPLSIPVTPMQAVVKVAKTVVKLAKK